LVSRFISIFQAQQLPWGSWQLYAYHDAALDGIRNDPRFASAIAAIETDIASQRENMREMERSGQIPAARDLIER